MPFKGFLGPSSEPGLLTRILRHVYILSQYSFIYNPESIFSPRPQNFPPASPNRIAPPGSQKRGAARVYHPSSSLAYQKKPRRVCAAHGANKVQIIFGGGVYVDKNTFRPASVEFSRQRRENYARSRVQSPQMRAQRSGSHLKRVKNSFLTRDLRPPTDAEPAKRLRAPVLGADIAARRLAPASRRLGVHRQLF